MTAPDNNVYSTAAARPDATSDSSGKHDATRDRAGVIVWRVSPHSDAGANTTGVPDGGDGPLTERLAQHLVTIYSDVHDTVADFDDDLHLQRAAEATGRTYALITDLDAASPIAHLPGPATLILLRWPRPTTGEATSDAPSMLRRCQRHLADTGSTIVVVTAAPPDTATASYRDHEQVLLPAARSAGLRHLHDIVPLDAVDGRDTFTYATDQHTAHASHLDRPRQDGVTTLMVFGHPRTATVTSRDSGDSNPAGRRQKLPTGPVTPDTRPPLNDRNLSPGDRDEQPNHPADESRYGAPPAESAAKGTRNNGLLRLNDPGQS
jgi:hypothetical protein